MFLFAGRGVRLLFPKMILLGFKMPWSLWVFKCFWRDYTPSLIRWSLIYGRTFTSILVAMFFQTCLKLRQKVLFCRPQGSQNCLMRKFRCDPGPSVFFRKAQRCRIRRLVFCWDGCTDTFLILGFFKLGICGIYMICIRIFIYMDIQWSYS